MGVSVGLVPRFPTLIASGFIAMAGIQAFFAGMILQVMTAKDRRDFEYRLNKVSLDKKTRMESIPKE